ncbi:hypothetical protein LCGC14_1290020 [marine sediment metagenome]|uniref:Uncharacterized protein n=1 Tax=marine sediment metagenome TaxID=412755 RepID=A0A0F9N9C1_9ZZZZ
MARKDGLRLRPNKIFASAALQTLYSDSVPRGLTWCFQQVAWTIDKATSGGNTRARLYIDGPAWKHYLEEQDAPVADTLYTYSEKVFLYPGERLALEIDQGQANTFADMSISGYRLEG